VINDRMDVNEWLRKQLEAADPDLLREMVRSFAEMLMGADADETCGAPYGVVSPDRVNRRNGYRTRRWDTRVGSVDVTKELPPRIEELRSCLQDSHRIMAGS
jgi:putative transposase